MSNTERRVFNRKLTSYYMSASMIKIMFTRKLSAILIIIIFSVLFYITPEVIFAHYWMAPKEEAAKQNPVSMDQISLEKGKQIFEQDCLYCHGANAEGLSKKTTGLNIDAPNLILRLKSHSEGDIHWKIRTGKNEMPSFAEDLSDTDIWHILNYLKSKFK